MSKTKISEFSTTPGDNTDINGINIAEGCAPSGINNAIRQMMADLKEWQSGAMDVYVVPAGTAAAPGIQFYGDLDTGIYRAGANQLGIAIGGVSVGYFDSTGWIGNIAATTLDATNIEVTNVKAKDGTAAFSIADSTGITTYSKEVVVAVNSASNAVRITQEGAGAAFVVEDSANPDSTPFVVAADGRVGVGTDSPTRNIHVTAASGTPGITLESTSNSASSLPGVLFNRTTTSTLTTELLGTMTWVHALTDASTTTAAQIYVTANNTAGSNTATMYVNAKTSEILQVNGTDVLTVASTGITVAGDAAVTNLNATTVDATNLEVTNVKAKDGTASFAIADTTGAVTVTKDAIVNGVTLGKGLGSVLTNTALGRSALAANTTGDLNTAVGNLSLTSNTGGTGNTAVGHVAMTSHQGGSLNTAVGTGSLTANLNGNNNTAVGQSALGAATGSSNTAIGSNAGGLITTGNKNTIVGNYSGNQGSLDIRTASNYVVLSDGDGNPRAYWNGADATFGGALTATTGNFTTIDTTNIEVTNVKAKDGTSAITIEDSTGYVGINASPDYRLHIDGSTSAGTRVFASSSSTEFFDSSAVELSRTTSTSGTRVVGSLLFTHTLTDTTKSTAGQITLTATNTPSAEASNLLLEADEITLSTLNGPVTAATLNSTTIDTTNLEVTNIKAKDGTAAIVLTDSTGAVAVSTALTANGGAVFNENGANVDFRVEGDTDANLIFADASTDRVGIGTSSPTNTLSVTGSANVTGNVTLGDATTDTVTVNGYIGVGGAPGASTAVTVAPTALTGTLQYGVSAQPTGTSAATNSIIAFDAFPQVANAVFTVNNVFGLSVRSGSKGASATATNWYGIQVADQTQGTNNYGITSLVSSGTNKWNIYASGTAANYFAGDVGINTATPRAQLDVRNASGTAGLIVTRGATTASPSVGLKVDSTKSFVESYGELILSTGALSGSPTERVRVDTVGNLGLGGVTPSAWGSSSTAIQNRNASLWATSAAAYLGYNYFYDGSARKYIASSFATEYTQLNGQHLWYTAASGTAGNTITFTQAMTLDASGRLLVGATSAIGTAQIQSASSSVDPFEGYRFANNSNGPALSLYKNRGASVGSNAIVASGDELGTVAFRGYDGAAYRAGAFITGAVDGTPGSGDMPGRLVFSTTADGASSPTERARITSGGNFQTSSGGSVQVGGAAARATTAGTNRVDIFDGTAPVGTLANGVSFYSAAGEANVMDAAGNATLLSPHDSETNEWIFRSKHTPSGKVLRIDVERLLRFVNDHFGLDAVKEFVEE